jgi:chromosome segregation ATPase
MSMRRADRRDGSYDNSINKPTSRQSEPLSYHEVKTRWLTVRTERDEWQQRAQDNAQKAEQTQQLYREEQQRYRTTLTLYQEEQERYQTTLTLYQDAHTQAQSYLTLYHQEQTRTIDLSTKYEAAEAERQQYLTLYNQAQDELKFERRSKAGIKGWETRRKRENDRLKQEIAEITLLLRDSMNREEGALTNLEEIANRMDRIQSLINSVEEEPTNPLGLLQKFKQIWQTVKDILAA